MVEPVGLIHSHVVPFITILSASVLWRKDMHLISTETSDTTVAEKMSFVSLPSEGDLTAEALTRCITNALKATLYATDLCCTFRSRPIISVQNKDQLPQLTSSMIIYSF